MIRAAGKHLEIRLASRPTGLPGPENFTLSQAAIPVAEKDGEVVVRNILLSLDPAMRGWMSPNKRSYIPPVEIGAVMRGGCVGEVVSSKNSKFAPGSVVVGMTGWTEFFKSSDGLGLSNATPGVPLDALLGPIGMTGLTAYFGLLDVCQPKETDTLLVSGAAGAVGSLVGQIARIKGLKNVVGIAGSDAKCEQLTRDFGYTAAINYKTVGGSGGLAKAIRQACPKGVDLVFENVGGESLDAALANINVGAKIALCGAISQYNATGPVPGPSNYLALIGQRARIQGFVVFDFAPKYKQALTDLTTWLKEGKLKYNVDIVNGLENAPTALLRLFDGSNTGKLLVRIGEDPKPKSKL